MRGVLRGAGLEGLEAGMRRIRWMALLLALPACSPPEKRGTVVCVHGFLRTRANHAAMAAGLRREGWRVVNWGYASRAKTIQDHAGDLVARLKTLAAEHPGEPLSFVTHSMGALVVRSALNRPDCPEEARRGRAVLLAPPNRGSAMARRLSGVPPVEWVFGRHAGRELMETPEGGFDALGDFPSSCEVLVLAGDAGGNPWLPGPDDGKVGVEETRLRTPHAFRRVHAGHSWIAWAPAAVRGACRFLDGGP